MEVIRKNHNDAKRNLIQSVSKEGEHILDVGCGFGDLNKFLLAHTTNYSYLGIDLVDKFLLEGQKRYKKESIVFQKGEFLETMFNNSFDYIIASGIFNYKLEGDNYQFIDSC